MLRYIKKGIYNPKEAVRFIRNKTREIIAWEKYYEQLPEPKKRASIRLTTTEEEKIRQGLIDSGVEIVNYQIDINKYKEYLNKAKYVDYPFYFNGGNHYNFAEKSLEHYLAFEFLEINNNDIYIDIANMDAPTPEIYSKLSGCEWYRQDLELPKGIHGKKIGSDAANMPLVDGFADKMALHCSFEHFENNSDIGFIKEAARVLKPGGRLCIVPLYMNTEYSIQTDPIAFEPGEVNFETDAMLYAAKGWRQRHGRNYDVPHFVSRISENCSPLKLKIIYLENQKEISDICYVKFIAIFDKP